MASVLAIISRKVFDKLAPGARLGDVVAIASYTGTKGALAQLAHGGTLFLVTVRPGEQLWLVGVLEEPYLEDDAWHAQLNAMPITDLTSRIDHLVFESGGGLAGGTLAQSLQTARVLTAGDEALLRGEVPTGATAEPTEADLLAQVLARPDDDAARAVLADWYLERGDVRGELLLRPDTLAKHQAAVLGALAAATTERRWEHGLLRAFKLAREDAATPDGWAAAARHPLLRAVREIVRGTAKPPRFRSFLASPLASALERIAVPDGPTLERLVEHPRPRLVELVLERPQPAMVARLADPDVLPALASLTLITRETDYEEVARTWAAFARPGVDVVLRVRTFYDGRDAAVRALVLGWLRRDPARTCIVQRIPFKNEIYELRMRGAELELVGDQFSVDEILAVRALMPLAKLTLTPRTGRNVEEHVRELCDVANTWWLGTEVRAFLATFPPERLVLHGDYAPLRALAGKGSSHAE